jgi:ubiquinone/menaquinone biosynthesis C-methylase UbiE/spore maturation protein CgeB
MTSERKESTSTHATPVNDDRIGEVYDGERGSARVQRVARARIHWLCRQALGRRILDIGCSHGVASILLAREGKEVVGLDREQGALDVAAERLAREVPEVQDRVTLVKAEARELPFEDQSFDSVLLGEVLEHQVDPEPVLTEAARVVRRGGRVVITTPYGVLEYHDHKEPLYLRDLFKLIGPVLDVEELELIDRYTGVVAVRPRGDGNEPRQGLIDRALELAERYRKNAGKSVSDFETVIRGLELAEQRLRSQDLRVLRLSENGAASLDEEPPEAVRMLSHLLDEEAERSLDLEARRSELADSLDSTLARLAELEAERLALAEPGIRTGDGATAAGSAAVEMRWLEQHDLPAGPIVRPELTVASIVDPFSELALRYEFNLLQFGRDDWLETLERETPDLLLVESAWRGNRGRWNYTMTREDSPAEALVDLVNWCKENGIPTVFWNKEDPANFAVFRNTALIFDHVFTVDSNCVPRYEELGHTSVSIWPFAAQPRIHNPVRAPGQHPERNVAFAGSYYGDKHPHRLEQMRVVLEPAAEFDLEIYSRFEDNPKHRFPEKLAEHVVGSLPYEQMISAYKSYQVALNVNSIVDSPTMCARRIFELLASGVSVVSGNAPAISSLLGQDLVWESDNPEETRRALEILLSSPELRERRTHRAMREVFKHHTYTRRIDAMLKRIGLPHLAPAKPPPVSIVCSTNRPGEIDTVIANAARQSYPELELVVVLHGLDLDADEVKRRAKEGGMTSVTVLKADRQLTLGECLNLGVEAAGGEYVSKFDDDNFYGTDYLADLIQAFGYTDARVVGKWACYTYLSHHDVLMLRFPRHEHRYANLLQGGTLTFDRELAKEIPFDPLPRGVDTAFLRNCRDRGVRAYSADRFNFVSVRQREPDGHTWNISDEELLRKGVVKTFGPNFDHVMA